VYRLQDARRAEGKATGLRVSCVPLTVFDITAHRSQSIYRGRFAPSPTGPLHLGSLLTAVASFLQARSIQGEWHLRIDDLDPERSLPDAADSIRRTLERFGLRWDHEIVFQHRKSDRYQQALERLQKEALVYPCTCSRRELASLPRGSIYPGSCRSRTPAEAGTPHALRVRTEGYVITFADRLHGIVRRDLEREIGDFVVRRRDGAFAYHLATVVDDADTGITEIVRGIDLLDSTPRQIYLQRLLGVPEPDYCHVPIVVDETGNKLSKQTFAASVEECGPAETIFKLLQMLRQEPPRQLAGAAPEEMLGWAVKHWKIDPLKGIEAVDPFAE